MHARIIIILLYIVSAYRGLYLGYLKGRSTIASMRVICSREYPNVLPHHKIRDNPNISRYVGGYTISCRLTGVNFTLVHMQILQAY